MIRSRALRLGLILLSLFTLAALPLSAQEAHDTAVTTEQVFVRSQPSTSDPIIGELFAGDVVTLHGEQQNGFISIFHDDYIGWVSMTYLSLNGDVAPPATEAPVDPTVPEPSVTPEPTPLPTEVPVTPEPTVAPEEEPAAPTGSIIWPVSGGEWRVLQGYNGSSHQNNSGLWQYGDSLDLVRADGGTAGETVYSPVSGTVRWFDPATGGISIDMGNGYAVAMFHLTYNGDIQEGDTVSQGQELGYVSGPGGPGYASTAHVHIALWQTSDGGNWNRVSVPFQGSLAISGYSLPNDGTGYQHTGLSFNP